MWFEEQAWASLARRLEAESNRCPRCWFDARQHCICAAVPPCRPTLPVRVLILMHHKEFHRASDDAKLLAIQLPPERCKIFIFGKPGDLDDLGAELDIDPDHTCILWPGACMRQHQTRVGPFSCARRPSSPLGGGGWLAVSGLHAGLTPLSNPARRRLPPSSPRGAPDAVMSRRRPQDGRRVCGLSPTFLWVGGEGEEAEEGRQGGRGGGDDDGARRSAVAPSGRPRWRLPSRAHDVSAPRQAARGKAATACCSAPDHALRLLASAARVRGRVGPLDCPERRPGRDARLHSRSVRATARGAGGVTRGVHAADGWGRDRQQRGPPLTTRGLTRGRLSEGEGRRAAITAQGRTFSTPHANRAHERRCVPRPPQKRRVTL
jgi:hypothetical protein